MNKVVSVQSTYVVLGLVVSLKNMKTFESVQ